MRPVSRRFVKLGAGGTARNLNSRCADSKPPRRDKGRNAGRRPRVGDRLDRQVDYAGNATLTQYNALGHVTQITEADGYTIGFERDPLGRITGAYNQEGHRVSLSLDADGKPRASTDPNNTQTSFTVDGLGNVTGESPPTAATSVHG